MKEEQNQNIAPGCNRRELLKLSVVAGITLLASSLPASAAAPKTDKTSINRQEFAVNHFLKSMNCSQAVLEAYAPSLGLDAETARRVATGFAGGMGMGSECGALTGAIMVLGLKYNGSTPETMKQVAQAVKEFKARHGQIGCSSLLGVDMGTAEGVNEAVKKGLFVKVCPNFVRSATEILDRILV